MTTFLILIFIFGFGGLHHRHHTAFLVLATAAAPSSARYYTIHWNSSNPIFRIDNTDNIIDVNRNNLKFEYDQVNLICPVYSPGTRDDEMEKYIIYNVSKEEYETCRITNPNPRIIAVCDKPYKLMYFTITFRPFTPQPGGLEFLPGHDYYFISTSTSDDLHRRIGGRCTTHNMKIVFKVWEEKTGSSSSTFQSSPAPTQQQQQPNPQKPIGGWSVIPSSSTQSTFGASVTSPTATNRNLHSSLLTTKKTNVFKKHPHPNEVVKSEELSLDGTGTNNESSGTKSVDKTNSGTKLHRVSSWKLLLLWHTVLTIFTVQFYPAYYIR